MHSMQWTLDELSRSLSIIEAQLQAVRAMEDAHPWLILLEPSHQAAEHMREMLDLMDGGETTMMEDGCDE